MRALNGEYIQPQAGGDLLRDGAGVLPTGQLNHSSSYYADRLCSCLLPSSETSPFDPLLTDIRDSWGDNHGDLSGP